MQYRALGIGAALILMALPATAQAAEPSRELRLHVHRHGNGPSHHHRRIAASGPRHRGHYAYHYAETPSYRRHPEYWGEDAPQGAPFDSGFFFATPRGPYGGETPYWH